MMPYIVITIYLHMLLVYREIEDIEDPYVTILPPSPSQMVAHFKKPSTATLLRRSASVPNALGDSNPQQLSVPVLFTASNSSMTSLYDDDTGSVAPRKPARVAPPPPKSSTNCSAPKKPPRRRSFSEDHPVLQRNTLLRETRKAYKKRYCGSPEITSTTFTFGSLNDVHCKTAESTPMKNVINTGASPSPQSEASVEVVNVLQQSSVSSATSSQHSNLSPGILRNKQNSATPVKRFASKEKVARRKSLPEYAISPTRSTQASNSFVFPVPPPRPPSTFITPVNTAYTKQHNSTPMKRFTKTDSHRQSLPDFMACPELSPISPTVFKQLSKNLSPPAATTNRFHKTHRRQRSQPEFMTCPEVSPISPTMVKQLSKDLSPPVAATDRFHKTHQRRQSLPEFMSFAPVNNPENQRKLQKALGGAQPQSVMAQQVSCYLANQIEVHFGLANSCIVVNC